MSKLKTVISFEYLSLAKSKSFIITTSIFVIFAVMAILFPQIMNLFSQGDSDGSQLTNAVEYIFMGWNSEINQAAFIDDTGYFSREMLEDRLGLEWIEYTSSEFEQLTAEVEAGEYLLLVYFTSPTEYMVVFENSMSGPPMGNMIRDLVYEVAQTTILERHGITNEHVLDELISIDVNPVLVPVGGGGFWLGYAMSFLIFFPLVFGGSMVSSSIVQEKTTKTVEILFTSVEPIVIVIGKVVATLGIIFTQLGLPLIAALITFTLTDGSVLKFISPEVLAVFDQKIIYVYIVLFFITAFVSFAFMFAAFASNVRDAQEASTVTTIPTLILVAAFYVGLITSFNPNLPNIVWLILSYSPLVSPFVMLIRITSANVPSHQIIISVLINVITAVIIPIICARIYKKNIMAYGQKNVWFSFPKLKLRKSIK